MKSTDNNKWINRGGVLRDEARVRDAVEASSTIKEALAVLGLRAAGGNYKAFRQACEHYNLKVPQESVETRVARLHSVVRDSIPLSQILVENSTYSRGHLKRRLLEEGLLRNECYNCRIGPVWDDKILSLQLDHINGVWDDNKLDNLRMLCPNCHSQTHSFAGRKPPKVKSDEWRKAPKPWLHRWSADELTSAVAVCSSWASVCAALSVTPSPKNYTRIQAVAAELGLNVAHLVRAPRVSRTSSQ